MRLFDHSHSKDVDWENSSFYNYYAGGVIYQALPNNNSRGGENNQNQERIRWQVERI